MPQFRYSAFDRQGRTVDGTVEATSRGEAAVTLNAQGLLVERLEDAMAGPRPVLPHRETAPAPPRPVPTAGTPISSGPTPVPATAHAVPTRAPSRRNRHLMVIFTQLHSLLKAGIAPHRAFEQIASGASSGRYRAALQDAASEAASGRPVSQALARHPSLFPPHVAPTLEAAEVGGFLPEAAARLADTAEVADRLARRSGWYVVTVFGLLASFPVSLAFIRAALGSWDAQEASGGTIAPIPLLMRQLVEAGGSALVAGGIFLGFAILVSLLWRSGRTERFRHRLAARTPLIGRRVRSESLARFAWTLSRLSKAGLSPYRAWSMAAATAPNLAIREALESAGSGTLEGVKASEMLQRVRVVPEEFSRIVETGELAGDVEGALARVAAISDNEFQGHAESEPRLVQVMVYPLLGILTLILAAILYTTWYGSLIQKILGE
jgi:type II secretory pathway component PulF